MYRTILLCTDGSEVAAAAVPHAAQLAASDPETRVLVLEVIDTVSQILAQSAGAGWMGGGAVAVETAEAAVAAEREQAETTLAAVKSQLEAAGARKIETMILEGPPASVIVDAATGEHADVIVMATHGRSGLGRVLLGSVADHVVRHARCPVLLVRPPED